MMAPHMRRDVVGGRRVPEPGQHPRTLRRARARNAAHTVESTGARSMVESEIPGEL